jgi:dihydroorotate dehydrogenase (fumarate)
MIDLTTNYLKLKLRTPLVVSASPISYEIEDIKKAEDCGASAIVMYSLFEEQLLSDKYELFHHLESHTESHAEALSYFPEVNDYLVGPEEYLNHIRKAKESVSIPVLGSLNGISPGGWIDFAKQIEEAGADALEMNIYDVPTELDITSKEIEEDYIEIVKEVKNIIKIPVAIKLGPYFSNLSNFAKRIDDTGADGLVLFNRFYQPDFDLEHLEVKPHILLSTPHDLRLPLRWIAILYGKLKCDLAGTGGVHKFTDALKFLMAGSKVAMLCSVLLRDGLEIINVIEKGIYNWMEEHEYESINQMIGSMSQKNVSHPHEFERAQYMKALHSVHYHKH